MIDRLLQILGPREVAHAGHYCDLLIVVEAVWLILPSAADGFVWREAFEHLQAAGEAVGADELL
jgi:hypothetical protein